MELNVDIQDLSPDATLKKLTGDTGVFVGGDSDLSAAKVRWEAMKAYDAGSATPEQVSLLRDLDAVMQFSKGTPPTPIPAPPPPRPPSPPSLPPAAAGSGTAFLNAMRRKHG